MVNPSPFLAGRRLKVTLLRPYFYGLFEWEEMERGVVDVGRGQNMAPMCSPQYMWHLEKCLFH